MLSYKILKKKTKYFLKTLNISLICLKTNIYTKLNTI